MGASSTASVSGVANVLSSSSTASVSGASILTDPKRDRKLIQLLSLYYVYWFDSSYPNGEYSGYQDMLHQYIYGIPYKIENNPTAAIRFLNTSLACTKYIAIVTGLKKKKVVREINDSPAVSHINIIKSFPMKVEKWSKAYNKVKVYRGFFDMVPDLKKIVHPLEFTSEVKVDTKTAIEFLAHPNPITMAQQTVDALRDEKAQQDDQLVYKTLYSLTLHRVIDWYKESNQSKNFNDLGEYFKKLGISYSSKEVYQDYLNLLKFAIKFDQHPLIISGITVDNVRKILKNSVIDIDNLPSTLNRITSESDLNDLDPNLIEDLHTTVVTALLIELLKKFGSSWITLYLPAMYLGDLDFCLKLFMQHVLDAGADLNSDSTHQKFAPTLTQACIASDMRISIFNDILQRTKDSPLNTEIDRESYYLTDKETELAKESSNIKDVLIFDFNTVKHKDLFEPLVKRIRKKCRVYKLVEDFCIDFKGHIELKNKVVYAIISDDFSKGDFEKLLNVFVRESITPLLIIYIPDPLEKEISKAMFKNKWIVTTVYAESFDGILDYMNDVEVDITKDMAYYAILYSDFSKTLSSVRNTQKQNIEDLQELDAGFEVLSEVNKSTYSGLVDEMSLGTKMMGSLHYYMWRQYKELGHIDIYWKTYASLFGILPKINNILDVNFGKNLLRAYTLQDQPPFYKLLNDVFRGGNPSQIAKYRAFYVILYDLTKKGILKHYCGTVFRGTYFNPSVIKGLKKGQKIFLSCFTSTSKSQSVAKEFARKSGRNVILEIELHPRGFSNIDIHDEKMSIYPEEQEVLLLPFTQFEVMSISTEEKLTIITMVEVLQEVEAVSIKGIDYSN